MSAAPAGLRVVQGASAAALVLLGLPLPAVPKLLQEGGENRLIGLLVLLVLSAYVSVLVLVRPKASVAWLGRGIALARALALAALLGLLALAVPALLGGEVRLLGLLAVALLPQVALILGARRLLAAVPESASAATGLGRVLLRAALAAVFGAGWLTLYGLTLHARREQEAQRLVAELEGLRTVTRNLEVTASKLPEFLHEGAVREARVARLDAILPREPLTDALAYTLRNTGARFGVEVEAPVPGSPTPASSTSGDELARLPLRLRAHGRLDDLVRFTERLSHLVRLVRVEALELQREQGSTFRADLELLSFHLTAPPATDGAAPCERTDADRFLLAEAVVVGNVLESSVKDEPGVRHAEARYRISDVFKGSFAAGTLISVAKTCLTRTGPASLAAYPSFFSTCPTDGALLPGTAPGSPKGMPQVLFLRSDSLRAEAAWVLVPRTGSPLLCGLGPTFFAGTPEAPGFERLAGFREAQK